jgi:thioredoxin-like negative regulator of GroEL
MKFLFFRADWCDPCKRMAPSIETTFDNNDIKSRYTLERINVDENPELAFKMKINSVPTCVIVDDNGKERSRRVGAMPQSKIMEWLETDFYSTLTIALKAPMAMLSSALAKKCKL